MGQEFNPLENATLIVPVAPSFSGIYIEDSPHDGPSVTNQIDESVHYLDSLKIVLMGGDRAKLLRRRQRVLEAGYIRVQVQAVRVENPT